MMLGQAVVSAKRKSSPTVVLSEIADRRIFQRGTTTATVPISGTWSTGTQAIEARVIDATTSAQVVAWTTVVASPTGSTWSGSLTVPQGGWYKIEVRRAGLAGSVKQGANRIGVGDIWLFAGQSQQLGMSGFWDNPPTPDALTVYANSDGSWMLPGEYTGPEGGTAGNGGKRFLNLMRQYTGVPQAIVQTSVASTAITDWEETDTAFVNAKNRLQAIGTIKGILWHQGGTGIGAVTKADYKARLAAIRAAFAQAGSFNLFGVFPLMHRLDAANSEDAVQQVRQAHYEYISENASTVNLGWTPDIPLSDDVHQTALGSELIAYDYAHALLYTMGIVTEPNIGPRITGVTRSGTTLTLTVQHNGGTSLKTPSGATATGFQVFPRNTAPTDAGALTLSGVTLGANTITLTLASDPGQAVDVYYQYGRFDNSAPVYDNSTALGRTTGNALQPLMSPVQSAVEAQVISNPAVQLTGTDSWIRYPDSVRWDFPDADWTMGVLCQITSNAPNGSSTQSYILSGGSYGGANSFNLVMYESSAGSGNANKIEFSVRGGGATAFYAKPATADVSVVDSTWRWWIMEFIKATETVNLYYCNVNGTRTLYASIATPALGVIGPTTGPGIGTRVPPANGSGLYLNGAIQEFFKLDGLLTADEVAQLAKGKSVRTDLGKTTQINTKFTTLSSAADTSGNGLTATLNGNAQTLVAGPVYRDPTTAIRFNGVDTRYTFADTASFDMPDSDWTLGVLCSVTDNSGTTAKYLFSNGNYQASMSFNLLFWGASASSNNQVTASMKGSGNTNIDLFTSKFPSFLSDGVWRLWTVERVKATETVNIYYTPVNGTRVLAASGSSASLGIIQPPGGASGVPTIGTRAVSPSGRWYFGDMHLEFQVNSLLTQSQTESIAKGVDLKTGLGLNPSWYIKTTDTTATITDLSGNGNTATLAGTAVKVDGPDFSYGEPLSGRDYLKYPFPKNGVWNRPIPSNATYATIGAGWASLPWGFQTWDSPDGYSLTFYQATSSDTLFNVRFYDTWWDVNGSTADGARGWLRQGNSLTVENDIITASSTSFPFDMNPYSTVTATANKDQTKPAAGKYLPFTNPTTLPYQIRVPAGAVPAPGSDGHMVIIQPDGRIFEAYGVVKVTQAQNAIVCTRYMMIDPKLRGDGWANGLTASMCPVMAGVIRNHEVDYPVNSGFIGINHAMKLAVPGDYLSTATPLFPAFTMDLTALTNTPAYNGPNALPMGVRLALPWSVNLSSRTWESDIGRAVATAAQKYGFIVTDRGGSGLTVFNERAPTQARLAAYDVGIGNDVSWVFDNVQRVTSTV